MDMLTEDYRGFGIVVTPVRDNGGQWDFDYVLTRAGAAVAGAPRSQTLGGFAGAGIACLAGMEVAKIEVDNLLALHEK